VLPLAAANIRLIGAFHVVCFRARGSFGAGERAV